ncbi:RNA-processing protein [Candidatus Woesearchaeota archaeon]|nr:MAG: RNA-processing protein [Candidatus Woesearchaeota archaeon]
MAEFMDTLKIPLDRVGVLIGPKGSLKKELEEETGTKISVDSKEGDVKIEGNDALGIFTAKEVVKAVGRGFNPDIAKLLIKQDYFFELININDYVKTKSSMERMKGRIIGAEGKARKTVEDLTETFISVYGKTIGIIGFADNVTAARKAVESLLQGSPHSHVYKWLERRRREIRLGQL